MICVLVYVLQLVNFNFVHQLCSVWIIALKLKYLTNVSTARCICSSDGVNPPHYIISISHTGLGPYQIMFAACKHQDGCITVTQISVLHSNLFCILLLHRLP